MSGGPHSGALIFGILLIMVGVIFILDNWYPSFSAWDLLLRYWPVILIAIGVKKLYGYFTWKEIPPLPKAQDKE